MKWTEDVKTKLTRREKQKLERISRRDKLSVAALTRAALYEAYDL